MIEFRLDKADSILYLKPQSALEEADFARLAQEVDPHIETTGRLAGILIQISSFPGWESLGAMAAHFRFVRDHHKKVKRVAVLTDSKVADVVKSLGSHFVAAEIRHFPAGEVEAARTWITGAR